LNINKVLKLNGTLLDKNQLENHLQKTAANHNIKAKADKETYPVPELKENFEFIKETYNLLNEHLKLEIGIHPAGEWLLDNFYIIEETVKQIEKELTLKKYVNFLGISNGSYEGFARIYVLASEIVAYTDGKIEKNDLEKYIESYQTKRTLNMDEIWNIGLFLQIAIINNIKEVCEKIYNSQLQKYKVEEIAERLIEHKEKDEQKFKSSKSLAKNTFQYMRYSFIEYMAYTLKRYGKKGYSYLKVLEETVEMAGSSVSDIIKKEHFDIAVKKVLMANYITSIKKIQRIDFLEVFQKLNGVEEILKHDPASVYSKMDHSTKSYYRNKIKEISSKTKISEIYIAKKILELCQRNQMMEVQEEKELKELSKEIEQNTLVEKENVIKKEAHIGYYLIDKGINDLYKELNFNKRPKMSNESKAKIYIFTFIFLSIIISAGITAIVNLKNIWLNIVGFVLLLIPSSEIVTQLMQYILSKVVKPKIIPKIDFSEGIDEDNSTIVVIPTILKTKEKVIELMHKLEVFYIANKSENLYFALLGDCSESDQKEEKYDNEVIEEGLKQAEELNKKYKKQDAPIFHFLYRNRTWNEKEGKYLGWERKRGLLNQFNEYILQTFWDTLKKQEENNKSFRVSTLTNIPTDIKYVITLDADTDLILGSAFELVGAMAHILNKPVIDKQKNIVVDGYGIIQPRVGVNLDISYKNLFTKIFAGAGGIDSYTNAISDVYQDNFGEGIFTGKGIYDLQTFSRVMRDTIPENTVLSHDLLEGNYLRCGLASDIMLMDGYPTKYMSFMTRLSRWIRGDWQIAKWLRVKDGEKIFLNLSFLSRFGKWIRGGWHVIKWVFKKDHKGEKTKSELIVEKIYSNPLNLLSRFKIFDNLRRSLLEISIITASLYYIIINKTCGQNIAFIQTLLIIIAVFPFVLEFFNLIIGKKENERKQKDFSPRIAGAKGALLRLLLTFGCLPFKAYTSIKAIIKTIYRCLISKKHLLEWTTSEEAEKQSKGDLFSYYRQMLVNVTFGALLIIFYPNAIGLIIGSLWAITPFVMCKISKEKKVKNSLEKLDKEEKEYVLDIAEKTWSFFEKYLNEEHNYLITDNYQEDRNEKAVERTSSTNIGLSMLAVISAYDLRIIEIDKCLDLLEKIIKTVESLEKWNGHLYNWYNIKTKAPLTPRYISTVDSGNFVGYLYVVKAFLEHFWDTSQNVQIDLNENVQFGKCPPNAQNLLLIVSNMIESTDFSKLYNREHQIFSIGFNIEENKLTDSYYDLLASEARQASLVAIAKKDVPSKHWNSLSRTITTLNDYSGLISWSGTAFEYLMPNINIPKYEGSLLDESCKFMLMSQMEYAKRLNLPWGISEAAFNLKDLHNNYQYKAFGIPWLGLKRGLADEFVVSSYGTILAIGDVPEATIKNLKLLENYGMNGKYGFYESIDFTPERVEKNKKASVVKTYMAHHQGLIMLAINNLFNDNILQRRFMQNPEMEAVSILLQERKPEKYIVTKEDKEKVEKLKYKDYEDYVVNSYNKIDEKLIRGNVISNKNYTVALNQKGVGFSKYKDIYINRFKQTADYAQGVFFYVKNIKTKEIITTNYAQNDNKKGTYEISFSPDKNETKIKQSNLKIDVIDTVDSNTPVEIRRLKLINLGNEEQTLEVSSYFEPVLSKKEQDYAHPAFNNLFLIYEYDEETNSLIVKRKNREEAANNVYLVTSMFTNSKDTSELEYEIDKEKLIGRGNLGIPNMIKNSIPFSNRQEFVTEPVVALKRTIKIKPEETITLDLVISVEEEKELAIDNLEKYRTTENVKRTFELSKARCETESRYLRIKGKDISNFQKMMSYILFQNPAKALATNKIPNVKNKKYSQSELWKYGISGDLPIILVKIKNPTESYVVKEILKAYEFFKNKNIEIELVILDEEKHSYENYVREEIENSILNNHMGYLKNIRGGIFELSSNEISKEDIELLEFVASIIIDSKFGGIENNLKEIEESYLENYKEISNDEIKQKFIEDNTQDIELLKDIDNLKYYNEYGAFSNDGKEYCITENAQNRLPTVWSNVLTNKKFGTIATDSFGGYTWYKNSRLNRLTAWENSPNFDMPGDTIYIKNLENRSAWSVALNPMPDTKNYNTVFGFGYNKYLHKCQGIEQELTVFVPKEDSIKVEILKLKNTTPTKKKLKVYYYTKPVLGEDEIKTSKFINLDFDGNNNTIIARNLYNNEIDGYSMYLSCSEKINSYTGDKSFFLGNGGLGNPDGISKIKLNNENSLGRNSCIAYEVDVELESFEEKEISILLGAENTVLDCKNMAYKYSKVQNCKQELEIIKNYWKNLLGRCEVKTPLESMNIILNGWAAYQTISSRLLARSGFYQSGGAFGFRDQLQDTFGIKYLEPEFLKKQIIKHSEHQFIEGDVEHWWHDETGRGIRTRFSDDLLWLPFAIAEYINFTGDNSILDIETSYLQGAELQEIQDEKYDLYLPSEIKESIYLHAVKAIEKSLNFGENGLPKIGSGDWNDGFSTVGNKGKGESVWLGFFLYDILEKFIPICKEKGDLDLAEKYEQIKQNLKHALNTSGWDGRWFKRAFMDDGNTLGSMENDECRIDGISQSWSVISNAGDNDKKFISMESLENHLVDKEHGIIKLLDPPFNKGKLKPGYIKAYLPGVRENGGQYTHASCWVIIAEAMLGFGNKALEYFRMINPIEHTRTKETANKYKTEPFSIAADIYGAGNLAGRGGWTWYTGSSSWYYKAGIEYILGLKIEKGILKIEPCIPNNWKEYSIKYKWKESIYNIKIQNPEGKNTGVTKVLLNENEVENEIKLDGTRNVYNIMVIM